MAKPASFVIHGRLYHVGKTYRPRAAGSRYPPRRLLGPAETRGYVLYDEPRVHPLSRIKRRITALSWHLWAGDELEEAEEGNR